MADRKARLAALRAKAGREPISTIGSDAGTAEQATTTTATASTNTPTTTTEESAAEVLQQALVQARRETTGNGASNIAPLPSSSTVVQKKNSDLKRDIQAKLDKLERRTQKAVVYLLRERLEQEDRTLNNNDDNEIGLD
jgi:oligoendopeptidase F